MYTVWCASLLLVCVLATTFGDFHGGGVDARRHRRSMLSVRGVADTDGPVVVEKKVEQQGVALMHLGGDTLRLTATEKDTEILVLAGEPIDEPIGREEFRKILESGRAGGREVTDNESMVMAGPASVLRLPLQI